MGADFDLTDVEQAVECVAERDNPELNQARIPPIFVPKLFLASVSEAIDMDIYPKELERQKKELESQIDLTQAKELKAVQNAKEKIRKAPAEKKADVTQKAKIRLEKQSTFRNHEIEFTDEHKELLKKLKEINQLDGRIT